MFERQQKITYRSTHSHDVFPAWRQLVQKYLSRNQYLKDRMP